MWNSVISSAATVSRKILENRRAILFAHLVCSSFGIIVLFPLVRVVSRLLMSLSGSSVLTDQDILYFALALPGAASCSVHRRARPGVRSVAGQSQAELGRTAIVAHSAVAGAAGPSGSLSLRIFLAGG